MGPRSVVIALAAIATGALSAMCEPSAPVEEVEPPCSALAALCDHCTDPSAKQTCNTAVDTGDDVQCTVALDSAQVMASCSVDDGGAADSAPDVVLPACGDAGVASDASCACAEPCDLACPSGGCDVTCTPGGTCAPSCQGGHCTVHCLSGAMCAGSCTGGECFFDCVAGSTCMNSCAGGGCVFTCEDNAVCDDSCANDAGCIGY